MKGFSVVIAALVAGTNAAMLGKRSPQVDCKTDLAGVSVQAPHLIIPVDKTDPDAAAGTSYFGEVSESISTLFKFNMPDGLGDRECSLVFGFPSKEQVNEADYTFQGDGKIKLTRVEDKVSTDTTYNNKPETKSVLNELVVAPGETTNIATFPCPDKEGPLSVEMASSGSTELRYFQDIGQNSFGLFVTACPES